MSWTATGNAVLLAVIQLVLVVAGAPLLVGLMRQVRARAEGRIGAGVLQPWSHCSWSPPSHWPWPASTPARRSVGWAPAGR